MATIDLPQLIAASARRLQEVRAIADNLRHDGDLHRLAMMAVFVMEDCYETFRVLEAEAEPKQK